MAEETILDLSSTVSVPGGNPAIAVTAPLTRPSAADFHWQSDQGWWKPVVMVTLRHGYRIGHHAARLTTYKDLLRIHTCNCRFTDYSTRPRLQLSDIEIEGLHHARRQLTVAPISWELGLLVTD